MNYDGNLPGPPTQQQFFSENYPKFPPKVVRKRPKFPYQFANPSSNYYQSELSNPFYQNYANHHQSPSSYYNYYNPTRYPSSPLSSNVYGHPLHQPQPQPSPSLYYPNYYTQNNNYANQFAYQQQRPNGQLPNFFNTIRETSNGPLNQLTNVGSQFSKALDDISVNDDLQCVPKLLCQMISNPRRPYQLPSFLNIPGLTA